MFHLIMFPHNGKVVMLDQITYHDPRLTVNPDNALPVVGGSLSMTLHFHKLVPEFRIKPC